MRAVALLSGGLDSVVSMALSPKEVNIILALTIDYGQRAAEKEIKASRTIARQMGIPHQIITLPFMKELQSDLVKNCSEAIANPWVPNRNGLFINLAACFAENMDAQLIICGFNREEASVFADNSAEYIAAVNKALYYSTRNHVKVKSFVQNMLKEDIVRQALQMNIDLNTVWSCYQGGEEPCGECSSCISNRNALRKAGYCDKDIDY